VTEQRDGDTRGELASAKQQLGTAAHLEAIRRPLATTGGGALQLLLDLEIFTKMPLTQICKLLSNFL
jgi:hypothetical protein